jgi:hypothetical protein
MSSKYSFHTCPSNWDDLNLEIEELIYRKLPPSSDPHQPTRKALGEWPVTKNLIDDENQQCPATDDTGLTLIDHRPSMVTSRQWKSCGNDEENHSGRFFLRCGLGSDHSRNMRR